ncbi:MAG: DUF938 domain-containing protein [Amylibacter sp.]|nr:DUF938 domain-containing protein [Amylibacter sp.]
MAIRPPAPTASIAIDADKSGKLHAPSAARNAADLCATVQSFAPSSGNALEIASGTGQHIVTFAATMPNIHWQPSEVETSRLASIKAYRAESGLTNIAAPITLNATQSGWGKTVPPKDLITLANLLHLISATEAETLIVEAAKALNPNGKQALYGPFKREGILTSSGDETFDANLRAHDPETGYKDDAWIKATATTAGLIQSQAHEMPANNLLLIFQKQ